MIYLKANKLIGNEIIIDQLPDNLICITAMYNTGNANCISVFMLEQFKKYNTKTMNNSSRFFETFKRVAYI